MKTIKITYWSDVPKDYTGIATGNNGIYWYKNGNFHREDGPAVVSYYKSKKDWWLDGKYIWSSSSKLDVTNQIVLSKTQHPLYPIVQVWKILDLERVYEKIIIPGMEEFITE